MTGSTDLGSRRTATLQDVARAAGVSVTTASRSLNPGAEHRVVTDAFRRRVLLAARRLEYNPNVPARAIANGSTSTVAAIVGDLADPTSSSIVSGLVAEADRRRLTVSIASTGRDHEREPELVRRLRAQRPGAIILAAPRVADRATESALREELTMYRRTGGRVACVGRNGLGVPTVELDDRGGGAALARAMSALGHRHVAALAGPVVSTATMDRLGGFRAAAEGDGRALVIDAVIHAALTRDDGYDGARRLLGARSRRPRLIVATDDVLAIGALAAVRDAGLVPGEDVAVAGFGDLPAARDVLPGLTTVRVPFEELGRRVVAIALDDPEGCGATVVGIGVVVRGSTPRLDRDRGAEGPPRLVRDDSSELLDSQSDRSLVWPVNENVNVHHCC
ncbi:LacI family DNA-binding transcriptional regulator [Agromyces mariniharenae]|uniref:LacI family transcriptional regulator n=1 Tax=Agromyces mariniharenae TaxID=2604423 RepID=A0A5S4V4N1_9MICO|nr:LacI family DNA-binding transcriptional regulator [Agromyces mariniharenae]TYL53138.1 LacI family transcriptional regulator [Agromyces mariniharenae]